MDIGIVSLRWLGHHTAHTKWTIKSLTELGHNVHLFTPKDHEFIGEFEDIERMTVCLLPSSPNEKQSPIQSYIESLFYRHRCFTEIFDSNIDLDVLHIPSLDQLQIPFLFTSTRENPPFPIVATIHRTDPFQKFKNDTVLSNKTAKNILRHPPRRVTKYATEKLVADETIDRLLVHSEQMKQRTVRKFHRIEHNSVRVVPNPTPPIQQDVSQREARKKIGIESPDPVLLFFGTLRHEKGPDILLDAAKMIKQPSTFLFAGKPGEITERDVVETNTNSEVNIKSRLEYIPENEVDLYFIAADCLVLPYRNQEGISSSLRRACMANKHIIGPESSDIGTTIEQNQLGQTFETGSVESLMENISYFLEENQKYPKKGVSSYAKEQHYQNAGKELEIIYSNL
ncbi:glycosyltransferase family 4 protein [Haloarcula sp. NS06]|uniref:glycosyltransferase family 4 protein n=1 Tax=Haloarcula sp. NS06 TaxID=3409688 RepID=UPI003DA77780